MGKARANQRVDYTIVVGMSASSTVDQGDFVVKASGQAASLGYATSSAGTQSGSVFFGIAKKAVDNSSGASDAKDVEAENGIFKVPFVNLCAGQVGSLAYLESATQLSASAADGGTVAGRVVKFESATEGWVDTRDRG